MRGERFGATPAEWQHFADTLGLTADLLPVVSNPRAKLSPLSSLKGLGKTPSRYNGQRNVVGFARWTEHQATSAEVEGWMLEPDYGLCVQTRAVRGVDVDIDDPARALDVALRVARELGEPPQYCHARFRRNSGRLLLMTAAPGDVPKKVVRLKGGGAVEMLGTGQQFVACGTHTSGERYLWATLEALLDARGGMA